MVPPFSITFYCQRVLTMSMGYESLGPGHLLWDTIDRGALCPAVALPSALIR